VDGVLPSFVFYARGSGRFLIEEEACEVDVLFGGYEMHCCLFTKLGELEGGGLGW